MFEQPLGMVAGCFGLDDGRLSWRSKTGEQHGGFELRGSDWRFVIDRDRIGGASDCQWKASAVSHLQYARAHFLQRVQYALHRTVAQGLVANEGNSYR